MIRTSRKPLRTALTLAVLLAAVNPARAQWPTDVATDIVITSTAYYTSGQSISDGAGGVISVWRDMRTNGAPANVYAQRLDVDGVRRWTHSGVALDGTDGFIDALRICPDDSGGVVVVWHKGTGTPTARILAQRVDANGQVRWGIPAPRVCSVESGQTFARVAPDGLGGVIVAWIDTRLGIYDALFAQRLTRDGVKLWSPAGIEVPGTHRVRTSELATRAAGGVYLQWWNTAELIRCGSLTETGSMAWGPTTFSSLIAGSSPPPIGLIPDGQGGALAHTPIDGGIMVRRLLPTGAQGTDAVRLNPGVWAQGDVDLVADGDGGAFVGWLDGRDLFSAGYYAQHWRADGTRAWPDNGIALGLGVQNSAGRNLLCTDGAGGVIGAWAFSSASLAGRLNGGGATVWASGTVQYTNSILTPSAALIPTTLNGAIAVWQSDFQLRAKRIVGNGTLSTLGVGDGPRGVSGLALAAAPLPARGPVMLRLSLPRAGDARVEVFGLRGERVALLAERAFSAGVHVLSWDATGIGTGVFLARVQTADGSASTRIVCID